MRKCPNCFAMSADDDRCDACGTHIRSRKQEKPAERFEKTCSCGATGIMTDSLTGGGPWYCREHWYRVKGYGGMQGLRGNDVIEADPPGVETVRRRQEMADWLAAGNRPMIAPPLPMPEVLTCDRSQTHG